MEQRQLEDLLYEQVARIGKALGSPKRLELRLALDQMAANPGQLVAVDRVALMEQAQRGEVVVIDVRPQDEFDAAHLPYARSMPLAEIGKRLAGLPLER